MKDDEFEEEEKEEEKEKEKEEKEKKGNNIINLDSEKELINPNNDLILELQDIKF